MKLGLDMDGFRRLPTDQRDAVIDFVIRHGIQRAVRYELAQEGVLDVLMHLTHGEDRIIPLRWGDHGAVCVMIWRRGIRIPEAPPVIKEVPEWD